MHCNMMAAITPLTRSNQPANAVDSVNMHVYVCLHMQLSGRNEYVRIDFHDISTVICKTYHIYVISAMEFTLLIVII